MTAASKNLEGAKNSKLALVGICLGFFAIQLDATIVNVALPTIGKELHADTGGLQWVVAAYTIALAALMLTAGSLADQHGARRLFGVGTVIFTASSVVCGAAPNLSVLVAARLVQGSGGALLLPTSLALISHQFTESKQNARALGMWGAFGSLGMASGPLLAGVLMSLWSWRAIFFVNIAVGVAIAVVLGRHVVETPTGGAKRLDVPCVVLACVALGAIAAGLIEAGHVVDAPIQTVVLLTAGIACSVAFVKWEKRAKHPMIELDLFKTREFESASAIGFLFNFALYGSLLCISLYLQHDRGFSAASTGLTLFPMALAVAAGSIVSGRLTANGGQRKAMLTGLSIAAVGALGVALVPTGTIGTAALLVSTILLGLVSIAMPAMTSIAVHAVAKDRSGSASGVFNTARQTGGAIGVSLMGSLVGTMGGFLTLPMIVAAVALTIATMVAATHT